MSSAKVGKDLQQAFRRLSRKVASVLLAADIHSDGWHHPHRLRHNAYRVVLDGDSYRAPRPLPKSAKSPVAKTPKSGNP